MHPFRFASRIPGARPWAAVGGLLLSGVSLAQDLPAPGFSLGAGVNPIPSILSATTTLSSGEIVVFDGTHVVQHFPDGTPFRTLGTLPQAVFPSFVLADPDESRVFVGESTNGNVYRAFVGGTESLDLVANLPLNYDAAMSDGAHLFVSAATCGFVCGNEIWRIDLATNQPTLVARTVGPSGPIVFDHEGNLYYGTVSPLFPPPPKPSAVWRWSAAQLASGTELDLSDATQIGGGFVGASRFAFDRRTKRLYLMENNYATGENRIRRVKGSADESPVVVEGRPFRSLGNLTLLPGEGPTVFREYQPEGALLVYTSTDFVTSSERIEVRPSRPTASMSGPGTSGPGDFVLEIQGGPPGGVASLWYCPSRNFHANEAVFRIGGLRLFLGLDAATTHGLTGLFPLDANGALRRTYTNPGTWQGTSALQALLFDADRKLVGSTTAAFL